MSDSSAGGNGTRRRAKSVHRDAESASVAGSLTYLRIVEQVTGSGISQKELGSAVGASVRSVQNWATGESAPRGGSRTRLLDMKYIVEELRAVYTEEATATSTVTARSICSPPVRSTG